MEFVWLVRDARRPLNHSPPVGNNCASDGIGAEWLTGGEGCPGGAEVPPETRILCLCLNRRLLSVPTRHCNGCNRFSMDSSGEIGFPFLSRSFGGGCCGVWSEVCSLRSKTTLSCDFDIGFGLAERRASAILTRFDRAAVGAPV